MPNHGNTASVLIVGASRGIGLAMTAEFAQQGWHVTATARDPRGGGLQGLAGAHPAQISIETLDLLAPQQLVGLSTRLAADRFDMLIVNAGTANRNQAETIAETSDEEFVRVMLTNALGVMRAVERLAACVRPDGLIGVMSSGQGSIGNNIKGGHEVYRGSKAALNQYMRSYAARSAGRRSMVLMAPGWIRTELGGPDAPFGIADTVPQIVATLVAQQGKPGLRFIDRFGATVPW